MNKDIMRKIGFAKEVGRVEAGICPFCLEKVNVNSMSDDDRKEYGISGLCPECQSRIFDEGKE